MEDRDRLDFVLDATRTGIWNYDSLNECFEWDRRTQSIWRIEALNTLRLAEVLNTVHDDDRPQFLRLLNDPADTKQDREVEVRIRRLGDGAERWIAFRARNMLSDGDGIIGTARDITEAKLYDAQVHLLMREVTHRSKNLLAIIQAMARQTVKDSLTAVDFEVRFSARLRGLSFSHEILAAQDWRGASLADLMRGHLDHMLDVYGDRVTIIGPAVFIRPEAAQNIGLALNELSSNALKFGALSGETGRISIEWSIDSDQNGPRWLHVVWNEFGGSAITPPSRQGFGHKVMERLVARALDGVVNMTFAPTGLQWSLRIPLVHLASDVSVAAE